MKNPHLELWRANFRWYHLYRLGHSIRVNRGITTRMMDSSKGWLFTCECGRTWAV